MQNSVLPQVSSQLYSNGYSDNISDLQMPMGSKVNANDTSFYGDSSLYPPQDQIEGVFAVCSQVPINFHQSGASSLMSMKSFDRHSFGALATPLPTKSNVHSSYHSKKQQQLFPADSVTARIDEYGICNARKRPIENANVFQQRRPEIMVDNKSSETEWPANKKLSLCFQGQPQDNYTKKYMKEVQKDRVPVRRSQRMADRITALQKLVSPYGKTDTASVLHEASIFIKALQDQIEKMFRALNSSPDNENSPQASEEMRYDLRNKGFCLVPASKIHKLVQEDAMYHYSPMVDSPTFPENLSTFV